MASVAAGSPLKRFADAAAQLRKAPETLPIGITTRGGTNHVVLCLAARALDRITGGVFIAFVMRSRLGVRIRASVALARRACRRMCRCARLRRRAPLQQLRGRGQQAVHVAPRDALRNLKAALQQLLRCCWSCCC